MGVLFFLVIQGIIRGLFIIRGGITRLKRISEFLILSFDKQGFVPTFLTLQI